MYSRQRASALEELATAAAQPLSGDRYRLRVPTYSGLLIAAQMLFVYAILLYIAFGVILIFPIAAALLAVKAGSGYTVQEAAAAIGISAVPLAVMLFAAAIAHGASTALSALRDIARNSFSR